MNITDYFDWRRTLQKAQSHAQRGHFDACLSACRTIIDLRNDDAEALMAVGGLLSSFGYVTDARKCYERVRILAPDNPRPLTALANIARDCGDHAMSRRLYETVLQYLPDDSAVRSNALMSLEYAPDVSDEERLSRARDWGQWAIARAGAAHPQPTLRNMHGRPLRVGYVSADFCQHTVGLFAKDVLTGHNRERVIPYAYSAGSVDDWVTAEIRKGCEFRDVALLDDAALASLIRHDEIDVLVDLSGHTAGSRLTVFASRPAPVQASWLGYFATTGLSVIDAVLLDEWHAPPGTESQFVERIIRLPGGRFCYTPVHFAPSEVAPPPCIAKGTVTFGCFNNTGKLNDGVLETWAQILAAVPDSRLILKWRTLQDAGMSDAIRAAFARLGIAPERIELRGASFHADLLKEYADVDIALDPFPFTGGLTSCEALWMGVPVVTWPQGRVVSRQTFAFLSAIGLPELAAKSREEYVRIAAGLAHDTARLQSLRRELRGYMCTSPLCDVAGFTHKLEEAFFALANDMAGSASVSCF